MGLEVEQAQLELQLKVWKELAISKQMLMRTATDALKLDPNCSQDELKAALETFIKKIAKSETDVAATQEQAKQSILAMERKLAMTEKSLSVAQTKAAGLEQAQAASAEAMAVERAGIVKELQKLKDRVAEKEKAVKAINTALADTPENVLKKMSALKKQKQEEADARREVEANFQTLRAEKQKQDQKMTAVQESSGKLITKYRDTHELLGKLHEQLKPLIKDETALPKLPELDADLIEAIEKPEEAKKKAEANLKKKK